MSGAPLRLLMLLILLLSGLHTAEPADASVTHHADSAHILFHEERGQVLDDDGSGSQQDADLHGSHHNCPVASDQALSGSHDLGRSEEHTSELQSLMRNSYAVFCLKKKKTNT